MSDLYDAVDGEIRAYTPGVAPPFELLADRKRRRDRRRVAITSGIVALAVVGVGSAAALVGTRLGDDDSLRPSTPSTAPEPTAPDVLVIDCGGAGPALPNGPRVAAQADGVHYTFRNQTELPMHTSFALGGDAVAPHASLSGMTPRATPGAQWAVSCFSDIETVKDHEIAVVVVDPKHVFTPVPECNGPTAISDFVATMTGDPVGLTLRSHDRADVVGYPEGQPRLVYTGDSLISWEGSGSSWVPSQTTTCETAADHVVAPGIKAPPPTQLAHTDEFGLAKAVRVHGSQIEVDVDRVDMLGGAEAQAAAAAAGTDVSNDYFLRNDNPALRTYRVSPTAVVWGNIAMLHKEPGAARTTLARWEQYVHSPDSELTLFHFQITAGVVTGIEEQYRP
jgi:hypothetical protein